MCRFLGVVSARPRPLAELLADELDPFLELACEHRDGWGASYIDARGDVVTIKEPCSALQSTALRSLVTDGVTSAAILHLRMASPELALTSANTHPFGDCRLGFAHNGEFSPVTVLDPMLGPAAVGAAGDTDSERYYLGVRHAMDAGLTPVGAVTGVAAEIQALASEWESLNCLLLTPRALYAYSRSNPGSRVRRRRGADFFDLRYLTGPDRVVVASVGWPATSPAWHPLPEGLILEIGRDLRTVLR
jgi:predicted glutamine amidotransferase